LRKLLNETSRGGTETAFGLLSLLKLARGIDIFFRRNGPARWFIHTGSYAMSGELRMGDATIGTVLIVEDEQELRGLFAFLLEGERFAVLEAVDGQSALEILQKHAATITLMITDLGLPQLGGVELIERAREFNPSIKIIGTSGLGGFKMRDIVLKAGADAFIPKPFSVDGVLNIVRALMQRS
jgi:CheY-like chemotaxis protein